MPGLVVVAGGMASLLPAGTWVTVEGVWEIPFLSAATSLTTCEALPPVLESDVELSFLGQTMEYYDSVFVTSPGTITIEEAEAVPGTTTILSTFGAEPCVIQTTTGTFTATVSVPATLIDGVSVETDPVVEKLGTWIVTEPGQMTVMAS